MRRRSLATIVLAVMACAATGRTAVAEEIPSLEIARTHLQKGRYEEALEVYAKLVQAKTDRALVALGRSKAHAALGQWTEAAAVVEAALKSGLDDPRLYARQAELQFLHGRHAEAEKNAAEAIRRNRDEPLAHLVQADVFSETGRLKEANEGYRWFIQYYNQAQPEDAETLLLVARGAVQYARWNRNTQIYNFAVNTLCPDAVKKDPTCWQVYEISGSLLLEKYNREQALPEFQQALAINPRAAEVHAALGLAALDQQELPQAEQHADKALAINPNLPAALLLKADVRLYQGNLAAAREFAEKARAMNPRDQRTLARVAACDLLEDGIPAGSELAALFQKLASPDRKIEPPTRFTVLVADLVRANPHPGRFFSELGELIESRRQFEAAEVIYKQAIDVMPQLPEPKTALGLLYMRVGKTDEARRILDRAFAADPYHVRVSNMRKVIRLLDGYLLIETDHFVIRVDSKLDATLGRYMAEYLEEVYGELVAEFGYEPQHRTQFEVFNSSGGQSAHQWFSARMVGLPWIQTIGASTGMMVALASPTAAKEPFNWARVVKHEFVHVITLQQTHFNIPHWFTEALAVTAEGTPRTALWNKLLLERVPQGRVRNLDTLDAGFQHPESPEDWQFAYCQSRLYAQYIVERFGAESIRKMLDGYRDNLPTEKVIERALGVGKADFEKGYREFLDKTVAELRKEQPDPRQVLNKAEQAHNSDKNNPQALAAYVDALKSLAHFEPDDPAPRKRLAQLALNAKNWQEAVDHGRSALYVDVLDADIHRMLGEGWLGLENPARAIREFETALDLKPGDNTLELQAARAALAAGEKKHARAKLENILKRDKNHDEAAKLLKSLE